MKIISGQDEIIEKTFSILYALRGTIQLKTQFVLNLEKSFSGKRSTTHNDFMFLTIYTTGTICRIFKLLCHCAVI